MRRAFLPALPLLLALSMIVAAQGPRLLSREWYAQFSGPYSEPVAPFRIVGNIHYVGAANIASYLIATPQGHILIDSGMTEMHDGITSSIERLGFAVSDIRILLASHAHFDHIEGHALMQRRTAPTAERMRNGERPHPLLNGAQAWTRQLATAEADFERRVAQERVQGRTPPT